MIEPVLATWTRGCSEALKKYINPLESEKTDFANCINRRGTFYTPVKFPKYCLMCSKKLTAPKIQLNVSLSLIQLLQLKICPKGNLKLSSRNLHIRYKVENSEKNETICEGICTKIDSRSKK